MNAARPWSLLRGTLLGLAAFAAAAHLLLLAGAAVPHWLAPLALLAGFASGACGPAPQVPAAVPAPRWLAWGCASALLVVFAVLVYGAIATGDREWDGAAAWSFKALALQNEPSLQQPLFAEHSIYLHSADYPLLQPLLLGAAMHWLGGQGGRLLFPALWLAMLATSGLALARAGTDRRIAWLTALGLGLTPALVTPGGGAVDSGYAELLVTVLLTVAGAGLLLGDATLLAAAAFCLPFAKPEGTVYCALLAVVTLFAGSRKNLLAVVVAGTAALLLWLPVRARLAGDDGGGPWLLALPVLAGFAVVAQELWRRRATALAVCSAAGGALVLAYLAATHAGNGALALHLRGLGCVGDKLAHAPEILGGLLTIAFFAPNQFGFLFALLALLTLLPRARLGACPSRALGALFCLGMCAVASELFLSPDPDVQHHLRSSAPRLIQHWCGVGWLLVGAWLGRIDGRAEARRVAPISQVDSIA